MRIHEEGDKIKPEPDFEDFDLDKIDALIYKEGKDSNEDEVTEGVSGWQMDKKDWITAAIVILAAGASFGIGRLSVMDDVREPVRIIPAPSADIPSDAKTVQTLPKSNEATVIKALNNDKAGLLVGSKTSDKYHYPWCSGALRMKEENKIWFKSAEEARAAGYTPAGNCKGLE